MRLLQRLAAKVGGAYGRGVTTCMLSACRGGWPRPGPLQGQSAMAKGPCKGVIDCGQGQPAREANGGCKGRQTPAVYWRSPAGAAAHRRDACRQKRRPQGLLPTASTGSTRLRPVRRGAAPVEVPPVGAEPTAGAAAPWHGGCQRARQSPPALGQRRRRSEGDGRARASF
ncbi:hypothetical protein B296_00002996 [Ensete ventricosum]|uniref:Uncharacterized protein n=1 Tax=Ensete ventricosum TaxID=4639 RepID=A0A427A685_ENSVE|nr:hypothetical protein B296_00002996 [Ensete ventricosum]